MKLFLTTFLSLIFSTLSIESVEFSAKTVYELAGKEEKSHFLSEEHLSEETSPSLTKNYNKVYIDSSHYTKKELDTLMKSNSKLHLILNDTQFNRWDIEQYIKNYRGRILILSSRWDKWNIMRVAEKYGLIFVDGSRFNQWDLQKITTAGAYILIDDKKLTPYQISKIIEINPSKTILFAGSLDGAEVAQFKKKGANIFLDGYLSRIEVAISKADAVKQSLKKKKIEETEAQKKPIDWIERYS